MAKLTLTEIWIYPIKSLAGIRVQQATVKQKGLEHDRRFMLVDEGGRFFTQREHPHMALFSVSIANDQMTIESKTSKRNLTIELKPNGGKPLSVQIWDDKVDAREVDPVYSNWFSQELKITCKLIYFPESNLRDVDPRYAGANEQVSLADGYPCLIIGQSSLDDLNNRLEVPIPMKRFRPNFVFAGGAPFEEDDWKNFKIGKNRFAAVKLCARCVLTTVDPDTGIKGKEPLVTLATFRKKENKILFGQNLLPIDYDEVREGDEIELC
ncbi:MAG: MOSC domain-containing protein [Cyclobacteriaceae bacterium]|nr:MOSC domain-containing protein [Cyclobacteriaceae bacterium]